MSNDLYGAIILSIFMAPFILITFLYEWDKYHIFVHRIKIKMFGSDDKWIQEVLDYIPPPKISKEEAKKRYKFWQRAAMIQAIIAELYCPIIAILKGYLTSNDIWGWIILILIYFMIFWPLMLIFSRDYLYYVVMDLKKSNLKNNRPTCLNKSK